MKITAALAATLALLGEVLDEPAHEIERSIGRLIADSQAAISAFVGVTVVIGTDPTLSFSLFADEAGPGDAVTSIKIPMPVREPGPEAFVVLYASRPGAFVDLAADITWLTGRPSHDLVVDQHVHVAAGPDRITAVYASRTVNQAIGVLLGRGRTPEQARLELDGRAAKAGVEPPMIAALILGNHGDDRGEEPSRS